MKKYWLLLLIQIFTLESKGQPIIDTIQSDKIIYELAFDSLPFWVDLKVRITPEDKRYSDSINKLLEKDYTQIFTMKRKKFIQRKSPDFTCDSCIYVAYFYKQTTYINSYDSSQLNKFSKKSNTQWPDSKIKFPPVILPFSIYKIDALTYVSLSQTKEFYTKEQEHFVDTINNRYLYEKYGNYYLGWFMFSRILYSIDHQYAFFFVSYNNYEFINIYCRKVDKEWRVEQVKVEDASILF